MGRSVCVVGRGDVRRVWGRVGQGSRGCREGKYLLFFVRLRWLGLTFGSCRVMCDRGSPDYV
jgi:hypothetical protein